MAAARSITPIAVVILALGALGLGWLAGGMPVPNGPTAEPASSAAVGSSARATPIEAGGSAPPATESELYSEWTTYDDAVRRSQATGKPVMLDFNAEWCGPCQLLRREVFENAAAGTTVKAAVIPVSIVDRRRENGENPEPVAALERRYEVEAFPTLVVFSPASGRAVRQVGYAGDAETLRWITETAAELR